MDFQYCTSALRKFGLVFEFRFGESNSFCFVDGAPVLPKVVVHVRRVVERWPTTRTALRQCNVFMRARVSQSSDFAKR